jgi:hypothetical protein
MGNVPYQEEIVGQVEGYVNQVEEIITTKMATLDAFLGQLQANMTYTVPFSNQEFVVPALDVSGYSGIAPTAPTLIEDTPPYPSDFELTDVSFDVAQFPAIALDAPDLPTREAPEMEELSFTAQEPSISGDVPLPTFPSYTLPEAYEIQPVQIRAFDGFQIPVFDGVFPEDDIGTLRADFNFIEPGYDSVIASPLRNLITDGLENGGTGLVAEVEEALFENYRTRLQEELEVAYRKEMQLFASKGHTRPPGALRGALQEVLNQYNRRLAEASRDIMIKQAELAQTNTQFILKLAADYEKATQDFYTVSTNRMLEAAKQAVVMAIEQQNARINRYNAVLKAYETKAAVFESSIKAQMLLIEEYKAELEAGKISIETQALYSQLYKDQLAGVQILLDAYEKQLRGAATFIEVEKNKIGLYQAQVEAFVARLGVDDRRLKLFTATLDADKSVASVWAEKMRGYGVAVDAVKSQNESTMTLAKLQDEIWNKTGIENYKLQLSKIESIIKNQETINASRAQIYESETKSYAASVSAYAANIEAITKAYTAQTAYASEQMQLIIKEAEFNQQALNSEHAVKVESLKAVVNVLAQLVSSALSAIHASMQLGYSGGYNANLSYQPDRHVNETHTFADYCAPSCTGKEE